jgi:hypothetical protein
MSNVYPLTALIGGTLLIIWRYLLRRDRLVPVTVEEPDDYGTPVAPTG